ncbi:MULTISPECIES: CerR family C-terminal domain-containing protein [unclassified Duganella]|jgi:AcrR family transcriptional regulator|uniref:CerR family C-terminal domain-containing protein n=1 Tax=unclassified Duganella TaxID=2636909 RepID=UPI0008802D02|nr:MULTISPECIES: CerR family C-terminal domain-containing protein [unclassified Duganella]SDF96179.1 transcriptional regulator, TetR family [Duganella sp. OV458]SDJ08599.1 transcriptional regulator, TetR family [Duganella sp. OV510]
MNAKPTQHDASQPADDGRKSRSDGEQSRERLLHAAMRLFGEQGFSKTSTREIAQAAGANVAAISYYFGDKAGLYQACFSAICTPVENNIAMFDQPHFTLRESLRGFYQQMTAPLMAGADAEVLLKLFYREMLEPTGFWQQEIQTNIKPEHMALAGVLCRHLGLQEPDERVHLLAYAVAAMCVQMLIGRDVVNAITPNLMSSPEAIAAWVEQLSGFAETLVVAEKIKLQQGKA